MVGGACQPCCAGLHPTCDPRCAARLGGRRLAGHFCPHSCSQSSLPCTRHCPLPSGFPEHDVVPETSFLPQQNKAPWDNPEGNPERNLGNTTTYKFHNKCLKSVARSTFKFVYLGSVGLTSESDLALTSDPQMQRNVKETRRQPAPHP